MRTLTIILTLTSLSLIVTNCGEDVKTSQTTDKQLPAQSPLPLERELQPENLIKYAVHKEDISDSPLKTQISIEIILEENANVTEQNLKELLTYLYQQQIIRTGFEHNDSPNTVLIHAYGSQKLAESGTGQWIAMISKLYDETKPDFEINEIQFRALTAVEQVRWGLNQQQRLEIWNGIIYAGREAQAMADKKYPLDKPNITQKDMINNVDLMRVQKAKKEKDLAKRYDVSIDIVDSIGTEGIKSGWVFPK